MLGVDDFREELEFLTGRYAMRKRPTHGRLFSFSPRLPYGAELLEDVSIAGTRMHIPTPPRSYPTMSADRFRRRRAASSDSGNPENSISADVGDVRVVITYGMRQRLSDLGLHRLSALDLQHSPPLHFKLVTCG